MAETAEEIKARKERERDELYSLDISDVEWLCAPGTEEHEERVEIAYLPGGAVASVYGLASMGSGFGGMLFTLITGWVVDHYSYTPVFIGFGILPLICALILWTLAGPLSPPESRKTRPLSTAL